jgi:hypothetical protein
MRRLFMVLMPLLASCGLLDDLDRVVAHCDLRVGIEPRDYCQEWRGMLKQPVYATPEGVCGALGTDFVLDECPDQADIVGGCFIGKLGDGSGSYWWFYTSDEAPLTAEDVRQGCESSGDTYVDWFPYDPDADDFGIE